MGEVIEVDHRVHQTGLTQQVRYGTREGGLPEPGDPCRTSTSTLFTSVDTRAGYLRLRCGLGLRVHEIACRRLSHGRVPGYELIEDTTVALDLQRIQRYAAVEEQDQVTGRAPGGGVGRVGVLAGSGA